MQRSKLQRNKPIIAQTLTLVAIIDERIVHIHDALKNALNKKAVSTQVAAVSSQVAGALGKFAQGIAKKAALAVKSKNQQPLLNLDAPNEPRSPAKKAAADVKPTTPKDTLTLADHYSRITETQILNKLGDDKLTNEVIDMHLDAILAHTSDATLQKIIKDTFEVYKALLAERRLVAGLGRDESKGEPLYSRIHNIRQTAQLQIRETSHPVLKRSSTIARRAEEFKQLEQQLNPNTPKTEPVSTPVIESKHPLLEKIDEIKKMQDDLNTRIKKYEVNETQLKADYKEVVIKKLRELKNSIEKSVNERKQQLAATHQSLQHLSENQAPLNTQLTTIEQHVQAGKALDEKQLTTLELKLANEFTYTVQDEKKSLVTHVNDWTAPAYDFFSEDKTIHEIHHLEHQLSSMIIQLGTEISKISNAVKSFPDIASEYAQLVHTTAQQMVAAQHALEVPIQALEQNSQQKAGSWILQDDWKKLEIAIAEIRKLNVEVSQDISDAEIQKLKLSENLLISELEKLHEELMKKITEYGMTYDSHCGTLKSTQKISLLLIDAQDKLAKKMRESVIAEMNPFIREEKEAILKSLRDSAKTTEQLKAQQLQMQQRTDEMREKVLAIRKLDAANKVKIAEREKQRLQEEKERAHKKEMELKEQAEKEKQRAQEEKERALQKEQESKANSNLELMQLRSYDQNRQVKNQVANGALPPTVETKSKNTTARLISIQPSKALRINPNSARTNYVALEASPTAKPKKTSWKSIALLSLSVVIAAAAYVGAAVVLPVSPWASVALIAGGSLAATYLGNKAQQLRDAEQNSVMLDSDSDNDISMTPLNSPSSSPKNSPRKTVNFAASQWSPRMHQKAKANDAVGMAEPLLTNSPRR